jgi:hypothetical protein
LEEDFFQALGGGTEFIEIPTGSDDHPRKVSSNELPLLALHLEEQARVLVLGAQRTAHSWDGFELLLHHQVVELAIPGSDFQQE